MFAAPYLLISSHRKQMTLPLNTEALYQVVVTSSAATPTQAASFSPSPVSRICLVIQSCLTVHNPMHSSVSSVSSVCGDSLGKNTGVGCHVLLQGIFPTQGLNQGLLHCRRILYHLSHQGSPK